MIDPYAPLVNSLSILPDNLHLGHENIVIEFQVPSSAITVDNDGNTQILTQSIIVEGRARTDTKKQSFSPTDGQDRSTLDLRVNVTKVDGVDGATVPSAIAPSIIGTATYTDKGSGNNIVGQFYVNGKANYSMAEVYSKVGNILIGTLEINGPG